MVHCSDFYGWRSPLPDEKCNESLRQELKQDFENFANLKTSGADSFKSNDIIFLLNNENRKLNDNDFTKSGRFTWFSSGEVGLIPSLCRTEWPLLYWKYISTTKTGDSNVKKQRSTRFTNVRLPDALRHHQ